MLQEPVLWHFTQTARLALKVFVKLEWFSKHCLNLETSFTRPLLRKEWPGFWKFKIPSRPMPGSSIQPSWVVKRLSVLTFFVHEQNQFLRLKTITKSFNHAQTNNFRSLLLCLKVWDFSVVNYTLLIVSQTAFPSLRLSYFCWVSDAFCHMNGT